MKIRLIVDGQGLLLSVGISAANLHDSQALIPLVRGIPPLRSRRGPRRRRPGRLHGDKGFRASSHPDAWADTAGSWSGPWLSGCRRLHRRYERKPEHFLTFTSIAATITCHRRLTK
ncbi:hypothetical protein GCM10010321_24610 [Streptomyces chartreusis]|nr:hypothetical protein GCM10010321_24610 [Streptomyces chartreusis]